MNVIIGVIINLTKLYPNSINPNKPLFIIINFIAPDTTVIGCYQPYRTSSDPCDLLSVLINLMGLDPTLINP